MLPFASDYTVGAHPEILRALNKTNLEGLPGYGEDVYTASAKEKIRHAIGCPEAEMFFLVGGTQTNAFVISTALSSCESVLCCASGHIALHEAGAIEHGGHKVVTLEGIDGKLSAASLCAYLEGFFADSNNAHMARPGMVYISQPTEYGTLYSKDELSALSDLCRSNKLKLYLDGARLSYALGAEKNDLSLSDIAELCDIFYIGGTKCGALFGEALIYPQGDAPKYAVSLIKQQGALLAKGWLTGLQFDILFTAGLYSSLGKNGVAQANKMKKILADKGIPFHIESPTNQLFPILPDRLLPLFSARVSYSFWEKKDHDHTVIRLAASWATTDEEIEEFASVIENAMLLFCK